MVSSYTKSNINKHRIVPQLAELPVIAEDPDPALSLTETIP